MDTAHERHISDISLTPGKTYKASTPSGVITLELGQQISIDLSLVDSNQVPLAAHQVVRPKFKTPIQKNFQTKAPFF
uniref:SJCHGC06774 protein n=1 Tax=Schistosoma japonicum TaxID=6182 RepID=Q5BS15_SCHJA|nr:SJCHGC06774 protein [Schistosoma japonicum]